MILDEVRAHVLAGRKLPAVWIPDLETRDDREAVRLRLEVATQRTRIKNQIRNLAKRSEMDLPDWFTTTGNWSRKSLAWLRDVGAGDRQLREGVGARSLAWLTCIRHCRRSSRLWTRPSAPKQRTPRYARTFRKLKLMQGVGTLAAMVFLTEMGDL